MKKVMLLALCVQLFYVNVKAQDVKHQTDELQSIKKGEYLCYLTEKDGDRYTGGMENLDYILKDIKDYKIQPGVHKEVYFVNGSNPERPEKRRESTYMYLPDNECFPITYVEAAYEGNEKLHKEVGYVKQKVRENTRRLVFLDGRIYIITQWKNKDNYTLKYVLELQEGKIGLFKMMKLSSKSPKKMKALQPREALQKYLDEATAKQKKVYAQWIKKPANKRLITNQKNKTILMDKVIRKMSKDWRNSAEYKRIQENNRIADKVRNENYLTLQNNTGSDIYIYEEGSRNGSALRANSRGSYSCKKPLYYTFKSNSSVNGNGSKITSGGNCGGTVQVN